MSLLSASNSCMSNTFGRVHGKNMRMYAFNSARLRLALSLGTSLRLFPRRRLATVGQEVWSQSGLLEAVPEAYASLSVLPIA